MTNECFKYGDWARIHAYKLGRVPILPQLLLPEPEFSLIRNPSEYKGSLMELRNRAANIWAIYYSEKSLLAQQKEYRDYAEKTTFIHIRDLHVPKYENPQRWSLTTHECTAIEKANLPTK